MGDRGDGVAGRDESEIKEFSVATRHVKPWWRVERDMGWGTNACKCHALTQSKLSAWLLIFHFSAGYCFLPPLHLTPLTSPRLSLREMQGEGESPLSCLPFGCLMSEYKHMLKDKKQKQNDSRSTITKFSSCSFFSSYICSLYVRWTIYAPYPKACVCMSVAGYY